MVLVDVIIPVVLVAGAGFLFARLIRFDTTALTKLTFYILGPALIFNSMLSPSISATSLGQVTLFVFAVHGALLILGGLGVRFTGWDTDTKTAAVLSFTFNNCGNYGLPVLLFAFGEAGFTLGVLYMVVHQVYQIFFGVGIASWRKGISSWSPRPRFRCSFSSSECRSRASRSEVCSGRRHQSRWPSSSFRLFSLGDWPPHSASTASCAPF
jgi:predicted permease